jgi:hypothetical protein
MLERRTAWEVLSSTARFADAIAGVLRFHVGRVDERD